MKKIYIAIILILILSTCYYKSVDDVQAVVEFTEAEKQRMLEHPVIKVASLDDYAPVEFYSGEKYEGLSMDYLNKISEETGLVFEHVFYEWKCILYINT